MNKTLAALLMVAMATLGGCAVVPVADPYYREPVRVAPPPPRLEYFGSPPVVGYVWITGYWNWGGVRYEWIPGRWVPPRHGHIWVPHRWEHEGGHWRQHGGRWERDARRPKQPENPGHPDRDGGR